MADRIRQFASAAASAAISLTRPNYFDNTKRGELHDLRNELNGDFQFMKKEAVKKVIAFMTVGKDVSSLFADVLKCMQTDDLELKKLVYLYLMNYAKSQPELVILAVNTFCKDTEDSNPLIRALAIRTMGCIRIERIMDYLCDPLRRGLKDESPYVRKTAALCVAKVFDLSAELAEENGFVEMLQELVNDPNPMVVSNAIVALADIQAAAPGTKALVLDSRSLGKLLGALNECAEWGQIHILDALAEYRPTYDQEIEDVIERVNPRLQHANFAVVLSAVKVLLIYYNYLPNNHELLIQIPKKLAPPLVSMLSAPSEIQYVALRNINLILQHRPQILSQGVRVFFCKYNDALYVKLEKLEIIVLLTTLENVEQVLTELGEYAREVDMVFVRKAVRAIGQCASKVPESAEKCVSLLTDLLKDQVSYVIQEDLLRRFPDQFVDILPLLCENMDVYDEAEAKAALIWILGEYGDHLVQPVQAIFSMLLENYHIEPVIVQLQLLTSCVKLAVKQDLFAPLCREAMSKAAVSADSADLRDRSVFYSRLLAHDPAITREIILAHAGILESPVDSLPADLLGNLIRQIGRVASVLHSPVAEIAQAFVIIDTDSNQSTAQLTSNQAKAIGNGMQSNVVRPPATPFADLLDLDIGRSLGNETSNVHSPQSPDTSSASRGNPTSTSAIPNIMDLLGEDL